MVEAVARHGYGGTTLGELVGLAGVSKTTFYEHFESKDDCFWETFETIVSAATEDALEVFGAAPEGDLRLRAALEAFGEALATAPKIAALVVIESLSLGQEGARRLERAMDPFERALREFYEDDQGRGPVSEVETRALVAGLRHVAYRGLRARRPDLFAASTADLTHWIVNYRPQEPDTASRSASKDADPRPSLNGQALGWDEPPDSVSSRRELSQRERILRAVAKVASEKGYAGLTVPAISGAAGVSNQTFYQEFEGKQEAFLAAFEALIGLALSRVTGVRRAEPDWTRAIEASLTAFLALIAADPIFAHVAFFEASAAGPLGLDSADAAMDRFMAFADAGQLPDGVEPPSPVVRQAVGGGLWAVIVTELDGGRGSQLPALAPQLSAFALAPFGIS